MRNPNLNGKPESEKGWVGANLKLKGEGGCETLEPQKKEWVGDS